MNPSASPVPIGENVMNSSPAVPIGVGIDTARYGHRVHFLHADKQPAAKPFTFKESSQGHAQVRQALEQLEQRHGKVHFHIRLDAAGQYASNLERFLRSLPFDKTLSIGEPKRNRDYCKVHFPKRKSDAVEAEACARFAIVEQPKATPPIPEAFVPLRELVSALESQVKQETRLLNRLHNLLSRVFPELATIAAELSACWVLKLLAKYPTAQRIAAARRAALLAIPHLTEDLADKLQAAARTTVASVQGDLIEELVQQSVQKIQCSQRDSQRLKALVERAFDALPASPHRQIETIIGIGKITAAVLVAKLINLDHLHRPESLVGYFGVFPEENSSGVDKHGQPLPPGTRHMSRKGNDLVRRYLWCAAWSAIQHNPVIRDLYRRQCVKGKSGAVALGHCMAKLLHQVFAVWKTDRPFAVPQTPTPAVPSAAPAQQPETAAPAQQEAVGRKGQRPKGQRPKKQAVTTATANVPAASSAGNTSEPVPPAAPATPAPAQAAPPSATSSRSFPVDFAELRQQITIEQVLREMGWWDCLTGQGAQRRGPCPIHGSSHADSRSFSVHVHNNLFHCFAANCGAHGNALDLWAQKQGIPILDAARDLAKRLHLQPRNREEEPVSNP